MDTFFATVQLVGDAHEDFLADPDRVWNMDEAAVDCLLRNLYKSFTASGKRIGGAQSIKSSYGISKHITAVCDRLYHSTVLHRSRQAHQLRMVGAGERRLHASAAGYNCEVW